MRKWKINVVVVWWVFFFLSGIFGYVYLCSRKFLLTIVQSKIIFYKGMF